LNRQGTATIQRPIVAKSNEGPSLNEEWIWAIALCALPFLVFGVLEAVGALRRRKMKAIAQRSKQR
jgi:hypothetical protein